MPSTLRKPPDRKLSPGPCLNPSHALHTPETTWQKTILRRESPPPPSPRHSPPCSPLPRAAQGNNELWLSLALRHPGVTNLSGPELAALMGTLLSAEVMKKAAGMLSTYSCTDAVVKVGRGGAGVGGGQGSS